jgi:IstB-like ATP binding protein
MTWLSQGGAELLFEVFKQRYERGSAIVTSNLPFTRVDQRSSFRSAAARCCDSDGTHDRLSARVQRELREIQAYFRKVWVTLVPDADRCRPSCSRYPALAWGQPAWPLQ